MLDAWNITRGFTCCCRRRIHAIPFFKRSTIPKRNLTRTFAAAVAVIAPFAVTSEASEPERAPSRIPQRAASTDMGNGKLVALACTCGVVLVALARVGDVVRAAYWRVLAHIETLELACLSSRACQTSVKQL